MNLDGINMENLGNIVSSLSPEDMQALSGMAQSLFGSLGGAQQKQPPFEKPPGSGREQTDGFDFAQMAKLASIMGALQGGKNDPRCDLLFALKPLLASEKQPKVDQAVKMMRLLSIIPKIKDLNSREG